jgi:glycosyltransferase involved in cell wall biosynthesis
MQIAILHYHLQTGGVTRVIEQTCRALLDGGHRVVVISGEPPAAGLPDGTRFALVRGLTYEERRPRLDGAALADALVAAAREALGTDPDLWHVHNHCLGKNLALPHAVGILIRQGRHLLLQPHDFAEDGRPALYQRLLARAAGGDVARLSALLYPLAPQVHYAVLNGRDRGFLASTGVPADRLHLLPNPVSADRPNRPSESLRHPFGKRRLWLYPTRAIRRKNLGELLLWAAVTDGDDLFATTRAPENPQERPRYEAWARLTEELRLPVELAIGERTTDFPALLASAHALVSTSIAEGFGLAFLEPWLLDRPLAGRDLPEITIDFRAAGVDLAGLYERLMVPLDWIDQARLRQTLERTLDAVMRAYGRKLVTNAGERLWHALTEDGQIDFGRLDEPAQAQVIRRLHASPTLRGTVAPAVLGAADDDVIESNRQVVQQVYSRSGYGSRLQAIYQRLLAETPTATPAAADAGALLDCFLQPERLYLLRS